VLTIWMIFEIKLLLHHCMFLFFIFCSFFLF
jgi:hypothetical protein